MHTHFADRLAARIEAVGAPVCVGLDPVLDKLPPAIPTSDPIDAIRTFCLGIIDATAPVAAAIKIQSACFERYHAPGVALIGELITACHDRDLIAILDAKRGDIGISAAHYAHAAFDPDHPADALTVSPYLGSETLEPFLSPSTGIFALVRTSNPGSDALQLAPLADGRPFCQLVAEHIATLGSAHLGQTGLSSVGAVVGATKSDQAAMLRTTMPDQIFLIPGYGAQGGTLADITPMLRPAATTLATAGILVTASRSIIYAHAALPPSPPNLSVSWQDAARAAAVAMRDELATLL